MQSLFYFNYLCGGPSGIGLSKSELELCLASRKSNSKRIVKLLDEVAMEVGLNTRVPHLEGETIFGTSKRKLDLPLGDDRNSHRHDRVNYAIPNVGVGVSFSQSRRFVRPSCMVGESFSSVRSSTPLLKSKMSMRSKTWAHYSSYGVPVASSRNPVFESPCSDATQFQIERILSESSETYRGHYGEKCCNARIAKYRRVVVGRIFLGIEMQSKSSDTHQVQAWFCPTRLDRCVLGPGAKLIINYLDVPNKWPVKLATNLSQLEITTLQLGGFVLEDRIPLENSSPATVVKVAVSKDPIAITSTRSEDPGNTAFAPPEIALKFNLGRSGSSMISFQNQLEPTLEGDKHPTLRDGRLIQFVLHPSPDHLKKMEGSRSISCSIMKYVKVPSPGYGIVLTLYIPGSVEQKELYEVSISNYPSCLYLDFKFMKAWANRKRKWMPCKHLYFVL